MEARMDMKGWTVQSSKQYTFPASINYVEDGQLYQQVQDGQSIIERRDSPIMMDNTI